MVDTGYCDYVVGRSWGAFGASRRRYQVRIVEGGIQEQGAGGGPARFSG